MAEFLAAQEIQVDLFCTERPFLVADLLHLAAHLLQKADEIAHVGNVRNVVDGDFFSGEQGGAEHLQSLVFRTLGSDFTVQLVSTFYFKRCHC